MRTCVWSRENEYLRNMYLVNNPLPICVYCKTPGHPEKQCRSKSNNENNSTTNYQNFIQNMTNPQPLLSLNPRNPYATQGHQPNFRPSQNNNQKTNNNNKKSIPPNQKYCFRFASHLPCHKPPCMFLHECQGCGRTDHGYNYWDKFTSTSFIPQS